jgi:hypothetical protein
MKQTQLFSPHDTDSVVGNLTELNKEIQKKIAG